MAGLTWAFTQFLLVRTIEDSLKGVLVESSAEGGSEEKTANGGEPSEDDTHGSSDNHASDGSADHPMPVTTMPPVAMAMGGLENQRRRRNSKTPIRLRVPW